ncbi:MAG: DUF1446 domain-containing protein [Planctomycetaceae bacterium]|jgi:NAD(P)-dependent dehydrogenase (short-subunit alcohol dehydrogenase family)|nr:DUF1446 domain-containing protein [Planctomycetaceae bacterium]MBT6154121.1 DUF1446 domain-containing protein [Planctomycetaceae bacterium]MBT6485800.1 DUF1446 domain-containing protein [Planctomycetaceae bacterium]MBT6494199.1 DUF1446 domain-containing protein [Planctomycetaceae bacterium]
MSVIRIGNGAGFWGDNLDAPQLLVETGQLDYLTLEYLAELTMSILAHQKSRDADAGYVTDFPVVLESLVPALKSQSHLTIVTNAGGMNPSACAAKVAEILSAARMDDVLIAAVSGDDLLPSLDEHLAAGETFNHFETDAPLAELRQQTLSANAYLGAAGIVEALSVGARIVITGRVADASLTVGPAVHEFGWSWDDWNRLAAATVAGHLIECGAQACGGMYSDWTEDISLSDVGYPIAELSDDGSLIITKPEGSGGVVNTGTLAEQLIYEIGDPQHYLTPDVDADFSNVELSQEGADRVRVAGARGNPHPEAFKVSLSYRDGYMVSGTLVICGPNATAKARRCGEMILERVKRAGHELSRTNIECLGAGDSLPRIALADNEPWEVVLRITAYDASREAVDRLSRELAPLVTSGPPGVTGYTGGRPKPRPVAAYWPTTIARNKVSPTVETKPASEWN